MEKIEIEEKIVAMLKTVYDPEIPVNVYDLGLIYKIDVSDSGEAALDMTLTAPNCPAADFIMEDIRQKVDVYKRQPGYLFYAGDIYSDWKNSRTGSHYLYGCLLYTSWYSRFNAFYGKPVYYMGKSG